MCKIYGIHYTAKKGWAKKKRVDTGNLKRLVIAPHSMIGNIFAVMCKSIDHGSHHTEVESCI
jgi:hypothetical protein